MVGFEFQQRQEFSQVQVLSQRQIQALNLLSLNSEDARETIYKAVEENPALEITHDSLQSGSASVKRILSLPSDYARSSRISAASSEQSDAFQEVLEAQADNRISLREHLESQLNLLDVTNAEKSLCLKLINNLDKRGFHILSPISLLDKSDSKQNADFLKKCLKIVQSFDPVGCCTTNTEESLFVQASQNVSAPKLALFLLNGHFSFLDPPQPAKIAKKLQQFFAEQNKMFAQDSAFVSESKTIPIDEKSVEEALSFIKTLDPYPARDYSSVETAYIVPDVEVAFLGEGEDFVKSPGIVIVENKAWEIRLNRKILPNVSLSKEFTESLKQKNLNESEKKMLNEKIKDAADFLENLAFRQNTLVRTCAEIVNVQHTFFENGEGNLKALKQSDLAKKLGVHETTISRSVNGKYLQCDWGLFELKYFFTNAIPQNQNEGDSISKDSVLFAIKEILEKNATSAKKMSDQKLCDALSERGIKIARRTVAKYRAQLHIESSYNR